MTSLERKMYSMENEANSYKIPVYEIFGPTIQGEGAHAGLRCMFVRTCLCNDHCSWCDSKYAWSTSDAKWLTQDEIFEAVKDKGCNTVILTGGNPCIHDFSKFIKLCHRSGMKVEVETQGGLYPQWLINTDLITFSPKAPSAGVKDQRSSIYEWLESIPSCWHMECTIKIPVFDDKDLAFAKETFSTIRNRFACRKDRAFYFHISVGNKDTESEGSIRDFVLTDYLSLINKINENPEGFEDVSILPQIHTLVWGNRSGV